MNAKNIKAPRVVTLQEALDRIAHELEWRKVAGVRLEAAGIVVCVAGGEKGRELAGAWDAMKADEQGPPS